VCTARDAGRDRARDSREENTFLFLGTRSR
jgi:hypothetical protein